MYFPAFQDKQKMQVSQPEHLGVTNQEVNVSIHRNNNQMYHIIHNLLFKKNRLSWSLQIYFLLTILLTFLGVLDLQFSS
jgi:hypothetical protein